MGIERTYTQNSQRWVSAAMARTPPTSAGGVLGEKFDLAFDVRSRISHTLCFSLSSLLNGALIIVRRTLEGALKCDLRDFLLEE
jgi:hypothetical protein